jgi:hypothetical protein
MSLLGKVWRVQTSRSFRATPLSAARPPTRSPRVSRREATPASRLKNVPEDALPPLVILQSASKSGAMDISPEKAIEVLQRYQELEKSTHPGWEAELCTGKQSSLDVMLVLMDHRFSDKASNLGSPIEDPQ